ncbi:MAG: phosphatidylglycerol lysyltransferase domain-containing protein [Candidatus Paceibacterota bacterium]
MQKNLESFFINKKFIYKKIEINNDSFKTILPLFSGESYPIFENSPFHILAYIKYDHDIFWVSQKDFSFILAINFNNNNILLLCPLIYNFQSFYETVLLIKKIINTKEIQIQSLNNLWMEKFKNELEKIEKRIEVRSPREVVYDVKKLIDLKGSEFSKIRNTKNRLIKNNILNFYAVDNENIQDVMNILNIWNETQGKKYQKKRKDKEKFMLETFKNINNSHEFKNFFCFEIGYINNQAVSLCVFHKSIQKEGWGIIYSIKGINRTCDGGFRGVSDATYLHCFEKAHNLGISFLNDGELGTEEGTASHKLRFKPVMFLKSFDLFL